MYFHIFMSLKYKLEYEIIIHKKPCIFSLSESCIRVVRSASLGKHVLMGLGYGNRWQIFVANLWADFKS